MPMVRPDIAMARDEAGETLDANARWLNANPNQLVLIEGRCDQRGTNAYNLALGGASRRGGAESTARSNAVKCAI